MWFERLKYKVRLFMLRYDDEVSVLLLIVSVITFAFIIR